MGVTCRPFFEIDGKGYTRFVVLIGKYAFKLPVIRKIYSRPGAGAFLRGLQSNKQEYSFSKEKWTGLCPVRLYVPGGVLIVMDRADPLSQEEWRNFDYKKFVAQGNEIALRKLELHGGDASRFTEPEYMLIPSENKIDSFGNINGRLVAIDYGGYR